MLTPTRLHGTAGHARRRRAWRVGALPGVDRALTHAARAAFGPARGQRLSARGVPAARDLARHALADVGGNVPRARAWARHARAWPTGPQAELLDDYSAVTCPVLLLWADTDRHPRWPPRRRQPRGLPDAQLRVLPRTGYLLANDDPVGVAGELIAFCG